MNRIDTMNRKEEYEQNRNTLNRIEYNIIYRTK